MPDRDQPKADDPRPGGPNVVQGVPFRRAGAPSAPPGPEPPPLEPPPSTARPAADLPEGVALDDFRAFMPMHNYIYTPARDTWPAASVNSRIPPVPLFWPDGRPKLNAKGEQETQTASAWLDQNRAVEQMTWAPGLPMIIRNRLIAEGGWIERDGVNCFNLYRPPVDAGGDADADEVQPWLSHVHRLYPPDIAFHLINWFAQRVQQPQKKINHGLILGGKPGIGKDTMLEPVKQAVGAWNCREISPQNLLEPFNDYVKSVILRVSEARDLGDIDRYSFYERTKSYTVTPPDVTRINEKHLRQYYVLNCCGPIITSNYTDGVYLPADDRRYFVTWSDLAKEDFEEGYWTNLWNWYENGGNASVAAYLAGLDISGFNPKAPPPRTAAFWAAVNANRAPEDAELADVLDRLSRTSATDPNVKIWPDAVTLARIQNAASGDFQVWIKDRKNRRQLPHRFEQCGYVPVRNDAADDGLWKIDAARQVIYAKAALSLRDQIKAAQQLKDGYPTYGGNP